MFHLPSPKFSTAVRSQTATRLTKAALQAAYVLSEDLGTSLAERLFTSPRRFERPERERGVLATGWPLSVEVTLRSPHRRGERVEVAAWRWGIGPTALLVHGWEGRGAQLGAFVEPLVRAGMSVVAFDAPGHGASPGRRLYLTDMADCIAQVADAVGPVHALIAHSFGAAATLVAHLRSGLDVPRNVMIAPNAIIEDAVAKFAHAVALDDRDRGALEQQLAARTGVAVSDLGLDRLVRERDAALLVVHDRGDREVAFSHGEELVARWRGATLSATLGLGHRRILRDRGVVAEAAAFASLGVSPPASELVREIDRLFDTSALRLDMPSPR